MYLWEVHCIVAEKHGHVEVGHCVLEATGQSSICDWRTEPWGKRAGMEQTSYLFCPSWVKKTVYNRIGDKSRSCQNSKCELHWCESDHQMLSNCKPPNPMMFEYVFLRVLSSLDLMIRSPDTSSQMIEAKSKRGGEMNVWMSVWMSVLSRNVPECRQRKVAELATSGWGLDGHIVMRSLAVLDSKKGFRYCGP